MNCLRALKVKVALYVYIHLRDDLKDVTVPCSCNEDEMKVKLIHLGKIEDLIFLNKSTFRLRTDEEKLEQC